MNSCKQKRNHKLQKIRLLYATSLGIIVLCLVLSLVKLIGFAEPSELENLLGQNTNPKNEYVMISNLNDASGVFQFDITLSDTLNHSVKAKVNSFDILVGVPSGTLSSKVQRYASWTVGLQLVCMLGMALAIIFAFIVLGSLDRNVRNNNKLFTRRNMGLLRWVGLLLVASSLCLDFIHYLDSLIAVDLMAGSNWQVDSRFTLHFVRILLGLTIVFVAEVFIIGGEMQEEQDLTI